MGHSRSVHYACAFAAYALLSGCNFDQPDDRICSHAPTQVAQGDMQACVHKWAYRLARAPGAASDIAEATIQACDDVALWNSRKLTDFEARQREYRQQIALAREQALFRVVQARAGKCSPP